MSTTSFTSKTTWGIGIGIVLLILVVVVVALSQFIKTDTAEEKKGSASEQLQQKNTEIEGPEWVTLQPNEGRLMLQVPVEGVHREKETEQLFRVIPLDESIEGDWLGELTVAQEKGLEERYGWKETVFGHHTVVATFRAKEGESLQDWWKRMEPTLNREGSYGAITEERLIGERTWLRSPKHFVIQDSSFIYVLSRQGFISWGTTQEEENAILKTAKFTR